MSELYLLHQVNAALTSRRAIHWVTSNRSSVVLQRAIAAAAQRSPGSGSPDGQPRDPAAAEQGWGLCAGLPPGLAPLSTDGKCSAGVPAHGQVRAAPDPEPLGISECLPVRICSFCLVFCWQDLGAFSQRIRDNRKTLFS